MRTGIVVALLAVIVSSNVGGLAAPPETTGIQGSLVDADGEALAGERVWRVEFFDAETSGAALGAPLTGTVTVAASGRFSISLAPPAEVVMAQGEVWYELAIDSNATPDGSIDSSDILASRVQVHSVLSARRAALADTAVIATTATHVLNHNRPPVAILEANRSVVVLGSPISGSVEFSLSQSYDPEGGALECGFDSTGNLLGPPVYGASDATSHTYATAGTYLAEGWVRDDEGLFDLDKTIVEAQVGGGSKAVDTAGWVGLHASLTVVNGAPGIAYYDYTNHDLKYVRASDATGGSWATPIAVDTAGAVGTFASLAVINGAPAIAYYDSANHALKYVRASDAIGGAWETPVVVDTDGWVGEHASLTVVNGAPAIAYFSYTNSDLKYVRASDSLGATWAAPIAVDTAGYVGEYASLTVVNGFPAIAYHDGTNSALKYVRATNASGTLWATPTVIDAPGFVGRYTSLAMVNSVPAIAYYDLTNGDLKYVRSNDAPGAEWATPIAVDTAGDVGRYASLAVVNGVPVIAYSDPTNHDLKCVRATDASGESWAMPIAVDTEGMVGSFPWLAAVNGAPSIAYHDNTNGTLKYVR